jgi:tryptophan synthase beta chain
MMETWGATVYPSPSDKTSFGRKVLKENPKTLGTLGLAISEAVEDALTHEDTNYSLGSVLNHVCLHQTIIGEEILAQFKKLGEYPDVVISCAGGGSNFAGSSFPFIRDKINGKRLILSRWNRQRAKPYQGDLYLRLWRHGADHSYYAHVYFRTYV